MQQNFYEGYYQIVAKHSGKVLDVKSGSTDNGAEIIQYLSTFLAWCNRSSKWLTSANAAATT